MAGIKDLIDRVAEDTQSTKKDAAAAIEAIFVAINEIVDAGDTLTIRNFGKFYPKTTKATIKRNPQTGEPVNVPEKTKMAFKVSKAQ